MRPRAAESKPARRGSYCMSDLRFPVRPTLAGAVWPEQASSGSRFARGVLLALVGSAVLALSARIAVPFWPVPMTLQTLAVLLIGAVFGARLAVATVLLYLVEGAIGLPVLAGTPQHGIGLPYMMGSTGGYLVGYIVAAAIVGWFAERGADRSFARLLGAMAVGDVVVFVLGFAWLSHLVGTTSAFELGVAPFIAGDVIKILLAALVVPSVWNLVVKRR